MDKTFCDALVRDSIGCYPSATVACFDATTGELPRRQLDADRNTEFLERLGRLGVPAVLIAASTGHGHVRSVDELREWFEVAARADLRRTVRVALLRPEDGRDANATLLDDLARLAYPVVFVRPGTDLSRNASEDEIVRNVGSVVEAAAARGFAVGIYSIPDVSGVRLTANAAAKLVQGPGGQRIVAAKITEADYETSTRQYLEHPQLKHLKIVQGWDPHLVRALQDGPRSDSQNRQRCGITSGPMSLAVYQYLHLLDCAAREDWDEARAAQAAVTLLFQSMQDDPAKFADLQRAKYIMGLGHPLLSTVTAEQTERVMTALRSLPRREDRQRLAMSLNLMRNGPCRDSLELLTRSDLDTSLQQLREIVGGFVEERDWRQFHSPKNLSMALAIEAGELMEHFQWLTTDESRDLANDPLRLAAVAEELADVLGYTLAIANELGVDLSSAVLDKMAKNRAKYPAAEFRGRYRLNPRPASSSADDAK
ncbi:MAG: hypothetical protein RIS70_4217 [Planctomycetota bacterium]